MKISKQEIKLDVYFLTCKYTILVIKNYSEIYLYYTEINILKYT